jgi:hypothetical protein
MIVFSQTSHINTIVVGHNMNKVLCKLNEFSIYIIMTRVCNSIAITEMSIRRCLLKLMLSGDLPGILAKLTGQRTMAYIIMSG